MAFWKKLLRHTPSHERLIMVPDRRGGCYSPKEPLDFSRLPGANPEEPDERLMMAFDGWGARIDKKE